MQHHKGGSIGGDGGSGMRRSKPRVALYIFLLGLGCGGNFDPRFIELGRV